MPDFHDWWTLLLTIGGAALGYFVSGINDSLKEMRRDDVKLADRVNAVEILVAGQYVRKDEFERKMDAMFSKLDRIDEKLTNHMDKQRRNNEC